MERYFSTRERTLLKLADARFGKDAEFTYVNREKGIARTLTLREALDACRYITDASDDEVMATLTRMNDMAKRLAAERQKRIARWLLDEERS